MKRDTPSHPKLVRLARALGVRRYVAVGVLQSLWDWAGRFCPTGDVGRHGFDVMADGIDYDGDPAELVDALVDTGWLDRFDDGRVLLHAWPEHAEDSVHRHLARARMFFANGETPRLTRLSARERDPIEAFYSQHAHPVQPTCARRAHEMRPASASASASASAIECVKSEADVDAPTLDDEPDPEAPASGDADPLADFPRLVGAWPKILDALQRAHPRARLPKPGSKVECEWRRTLAALVRLDRYEELDVVDTLRWLLKSDDEPAVFWRRQVAALPPLRKRKDGFSKFDRIHEAFQNARGGDLSHGAARDALRAAIAAQTDAEGAE
jgi:hypothetical protein